MRSRESIIDFTITQTGGLDSLIDLMSFNGVLTLDIHESTQLETVESMITNDRVVGFFKSNDLPSTAPLLLATPPSEFSPSFSQSFN